MSLYDVAVVLSATIVIYIPFRLLLALVTAQIFGSERLVGAGASAHTLDSGAIARRAMISIPAGLLFCFVVASHAPNPWPTFSGMVGIAAFGLMELGARAARAHSLGDSGHLAARGVYRTTMGWTAMLVVFGMAPLPFLPAEDFVAERISAVSALVRDYAFALLPEIVLYGVAAICSLVAIAYQLLELKDIVQRR
jgi:hypothetical protein